MYTVSYPIHNGTLSLHKDDVDIFIFIFENWVPEDWRLQHHVLLM